MGIDSTRIQKNLELFSFPRLSGTEYEKKAFDLAKQKIQEMNLKPEIQTFRFSTFYSRVYPKISFPIVFWIFFTFYLNLNQLFLLLSLSISFLIFFPLFLLTRSPEKIRVGNILESQNLYVKLNANSNTQPINQMNIFFMAHLDSKGQRITARTRGLSIFLFTISLLTNAVILVLRYLLSSLSQLFNFIGIFPMIILLITTITLSINITNNDSKGVVDNASGIACVFELLHYFSSRVNAIRKYNLWFVFTGAEESGTMGIRHFYKIIKDINRDKAIVNNFESLGKSINIVVSKNTLNNNANYYNFIQKKADEKKLNIFINPLTRGIHTDGIYLAQNDFSLFEYGSSEVGKYMHSEFDSLENVDTEMLKTLCEFIVSTTIEYLNK